MTKAIPVISKYMTTSPHTIGAGQSLATASKRMRELRIRHLPVLEDRKLVGVVSERDIALVETLHGIDPEKVTVDEAMTQFPYTTTPETSVDQVAAEMAKHKYGSAIVMQNGHVVGIFTAVDACAVLADVFEHRLR